ncbi:glycosyltransferase family 9 protein [Luteibacter sp. PPL554]
MTRALPLTRTSTAAPSRAPQHGRLQAWRRRAVRWLIGRLLPPTGNEVTAGALPPSGIQRVLVCRPNHRLGNTVLMTPLMAELERLYPGAEVDVLGAGAAPRGVYGGYAALGDLFLLAPKAVRHPIATVATIRALRRKRYDLVIDAAAGSSSGKLLASLATARFRLGVDTAGDTLPLHLAARPVHALRWAAGRDMARPMPRLDLRLSDTERCTGRATLERVLAAAPGGDAPVLAIFPNATGAKRYDEAWWTTFLAELTSHTGPLRIVELVAADGRSRVNDRYPTYFTSDLRKLSAFIEAAGMYISADCGVMHLAGATQALTLGLFGTTDARRYAPYGGMNLAIRSEDGNAAGAALRAAEAIGRWRAMR